MLKFKKDKNGKFKTVGNTVKKMNDLIWIIFEILTNKRSSEKRLENYQQM